MVGQPMQPGVFVPAPPPPSGSFVPAADPGNFVHTAAPAQPMSATQPAAPAQPLHATQLAAPAHANAPPQPAPQPVPRASPPPFRPSRNPIVRLILWFTEPSMIKGMAMGVILALVISVAFRLEAMWFIASSVLTLLITCLFGVLIGHYIFENRRKKLQARGLDLLRQAGGELPGISDDLVTLIMNRDRNALPVMWDRLRRIRPAAEEIAGLSVAAIFRVMAMTTLFAVLGGAISFAVFLTSYMQVERMDAQNKLIEQQIEQTKTQMENSERESQIAVALSIAERRQVTIREVFTVISGDRGQTQDGKRNLSTATANLIAVAVSQLRPYRSVDVDETSANVLARQIRSPEQEQLLRYLSAANVDFSGLDLSRAFLDHADLHGTDLAQIQLPRVRMRETSVYDVKLTGANLSGADLTLAALARSDLSGSNLAAAILHKANLGDTIFAEANLADADLSGAILKKAVFKQTQLGRALLHGANLAQTDLNGADITEADLALADLSAATLPTVPKVRAAAYWWLAIYPPDYAAKLGLPADAQKRNQDALTRLRAAADQAAMKAIVEELKTAAPNAPA
jgi:uncharacterized protein YjbI with pentapeptide repeats